MKISLFLATTEDIAKFFLHLNCTLVYIVMSRTKLRKPACYVPVKTSGAAFSLHEREYDIWPGRKPDSGRSFSRKGDFIFQTEKSSRKAELEAEKSHGFPIMIIKG
jgi:hypothetical protein